MHPDNETILARLIRMEEKLDSHLFRTSTTENRLDGHDVRLRAVEQGHSKVLGVAGVIALVVSGFGASLIELISR